MQVFRKGVRGRGVPVFCVSILFFLLILMADAPSIAAAVRTKPAAVSSAALEKRIHELVNSEREENGLAPLHWDERLSATARSHGRDMAVHGYFSHANRKGEDPTARGLRDGYRCAKRKGAYRLEGLAENLYQRTLYTSILYRNDVPSYTWSSLEEIAHSAVQGWMRSPGHRRNILNPDHDREGIGVALGVENLVYIVEMFC
ncbi:MAG: CAP domain-containing protein [Nitrospirales bacterium]|nr:CAP domain-containing protein [Nitrospirales bacterium]